MPPIADLIQSAADVLFVPVLVVVLFGSGIFLTVRLGFVQVRRFGEAVREFFGGRSRTATAMSSMVRGLKTAIIRESQLRGTLTSEMSR